MPEFADSANLEFFPILATASRLNGAVAFLRESVSQRAEPEGHV